MDVTVIRAYATQYGINLPDDPSLMWLSIHKARTGATDLPMFERAASKQWLFLHESHPLDDGEVMPPVKSPAEMEKYFARLQQWRAQE
jgi:hypothetical protein